MDGSRNKAEAEEEEDHIALKRPKRKRITQHQKGQV
jgi:hypothetical protein